METLLLLQQFNNDANNLVDVAIIKLKYWKDKFATRGMKPTPQEMEAEYTTGLNNLMKRMRQVTQKVLTGNENQELAARVRREGQRYIKRFIDECSPTPAEHIDE